MLRLNRLGIAFIAGFVGTVAAGSDGREGDTAGIGAAGPIALSQPGLLQDSRRVPAAEAPPVDLQRVAREDEARELAGLAPRFAIPNPVSITPDSGGLWEKGAPDTDVWRLRVSSPGALSLNLGFTRYHMPEGGRLFIYSTDLSQVARPFTAADNADHGELWTPVVPADEITVEVSVPSAVRDRLDLELGSINVGYRGFGDTSALRSGSCNVDVICPEGDPWRLDIQAVGVISTGGSTFCTGFMVNNTANDLTPYFMTADHCGVTAGNAASLVVYWNYENSICRPPGSPASGGPGDGSLATFNTGSTFRASYGPSDVTLVQLTADPDPAWNISYAGWDNTGVDATSAVAIHHPNTDEKRISFEYQPTSTTTYLGTAIPGDGTHVRVTQWDLGTTEPGSSGSPLFDQNHRVIGQLHGGYASCTSLTSDWYGKFAVSWTGGGTASTRLSDWLDAAGTGATTVDTISLATLCSDAGVISLERANFACIDVAGLEVIDCGLNLDPAVAETVTVTIASATEPGGESVLLTETQVDSARFQGSIELNTTDFVGVLAVSEGDIITATYVDADDGAGGVNIIVTATATVDCTPPVLSNVVVADVQPRSATITFNANEPVLGSVYSGLDCAIVPQKDSALGYNTAVTVNVTGLQDNTTYFFKAHGEDEAGNGAFDDNGGTCYTFTTPEVPDYFTEEFGGGFDLSNSMATFVPNGSVDFYAGCVEPITILPTDPIGGTPLGLSDDGSISITPTAAVSLYGVSRASMFVNANGNITFLAGDSDYTESLADHFSEPRISGLFDDLNPSVGGQVSWKELADRVAVTWENVPQYGTSDSNTLQIEMFFDGTIRLSYLAVAAGDGIVGLSEGNGVSPDFFETDLSLMGSCGPRPPSASSAQVNTPVGTPVTIVLQAGDDGLPDPPAALTYIVTSLPTYPLRDVGGAHVITAGELPYTLVGGGNQVEYLPGGVFSGSDGFQFKANDGGVPPDGGDSNLATVSITVGGPQAVYSYPLDADPGWGVTGQWAFGAPTGGGTHNGDPVSGNTGANVYGYNLAGDYPNNMATVEYLTTTAIDCTALSQVELRFWKWLGVESATYDHANVQVSNDGVTWTGVWNHSGGAVSDASWNQMVFDISAVADGQAAVQVRWGMGTTDGSVTYPGWNVDDVEIWGIVPTLPGDFDGDGDVDLADFEKFATCMTGPDAGPPVITQCEVFLFDADTDIDLADFVGFLAVFTN